MLRARWTHVTWRAKQTETTSGSVGSPAVVSSEPLSEPLSPGAVEPLGSEEASKTEVPLVLAPVVEDSPLASPVLVEVVPASPVLVEVDGTSLEALVPALSAALVVSVLVRDASHDDVLPSPPSSSSSSCRRASRQASLITSQVSCCANGTSSRHSAYASTHSPKGSSWQATTIADSDSPTIARSATPHEVRAIFEPMLVLMDACNTCAP